MPPGGAQETSQFSYLVLPTITQVVASDLVLLFLLSIPVALTALHDHTNLLCHSMNSFPFFLALAKKLAVLPQT